MANGTQEQTLDQVEILAKVFPTDSLEYKLLLRYTQKKKTKNSHPPQSNGVGEGTVASPTRPRNQRKPKKRKHKFLSIISCIRSVKEDDGPLARLPAAADISGQEQEKVEQIVNKLTNITDHVHFMPTDIETDGDDVIERIVELLRDHGDKLNEEIENNQVLKKQLQDCLSYNFFTRLTQSFMKRLSPEDLPAAQSSKQAEIALTCELTSRLNAMDCLPMSRVLGFGAKYLQDYLSPWVIQQGGYEKVFGTDCDDEEEVH